VVALSIVLALAMLLFAVRKVRQSRRLQILATTDELTGALNRRAVMAFAEQALVRADADRAPLALLLIDVDHFKRINDRHGHPAGDRVLRELARALQGGLRGGDPLGRIARGLRKNDEELFAADAAAQIAERMRAVCNGTEVDTAGGPLRFSISVGIAHTRCHGISLSTLIGEADAALYCAKSGGRNAVSVFDPGLAAAALTPA
jgi:diguanylate cyclase (GGDEF)-like protein